MTMLDFSFRHAGDFPSPDRGYFFQAETAQPAMQLTESVGAHQLPCGLADMCSTVDLRVHRYRGISFHTSDLPIVIP